MEFGSFMIGERCAVPKKKRDACYNDYQMSAHPSQRDNLIPSGSCPLIESGAGSSSTLCIFASAPDPTTENQELNHTWPNSTLLRDMLYPQPNIDHHLKKSNVRYS